MPSYEFPSQVEAKEVSMRGFTGVDFTSDLVQVASYRSPDSLNMVWSKFGAPVKRGGIKAVAKTPIDAPINNIFEYEWEGVNALIVHCGTKLYHWDHTVPFARVFDYSDIDFEDFTFNTDPLAQPERGDFKEIDLYDIELTNGRSHMWQFGQHFYLIDGAHFIIIQPRHPITPGGDPTDAWVFEAWDLSTYADDFRITSCYKPTTRIGAKPDGTGGQPYEYANALTNIEINEFIADGSATLFRLSASAITGTPQYMVRNASGEWPPDDPTAPDPWKNVTTVNAAAGTVTITPAPAATPVTGEDNVRIRFNNAIPSQMDQIKTCTIGYKWDIHNGSCLVLSGNKTYRNKDWTSYYDNPLYFPDTFTGLVGETDSAIVAYTMLNGKLVIFKSDDAVEAVTYIRDMQVDDDFDVTLTTRQAFSGLSAISQYCIADLQGDALMLSYKGVFNVSDSVSAANRYANARSTLINKKLLASADLSEAFLQVVGSRLYLFCGNTIYVADKYITGKTETTNHELEWLYWESLKFKCAYALPRAYATYSERDENRAQRVLTMGDERGFIYQYFDGTQSGHFMDWTTSEKDSSGEWVHTLTPIKARWVFPYVFMDTESRYKSIKRMYAIIVPYAKTSVDIYSKIRGGWKLEAHDDVSLFSFWDIDFNNFSFNSDSDAYVCKARVRIRRVVLFQAKVENTMPRQGFGLLSMRYVYTLNGYAR